MNPFSAFLQPPTQRSPLAGAGEFVQGLQQQALQKRAQEFRERESGLDNARADSYLKLQQSQQARSFSEADKKEVEAALAEYQDAEDQGDPVRLSRAAQMLKRFGMDVSQGMDPRAAAFTGAKPLPGMLPMVPGKGNAFTGTAPDQANPIGDAIATEQATRDKLRSRIEAPDLSQEDFERELIEGSPIPPERYESTSSGKPGTTPEFKARIAAMDAGLPKELPALPGQGLPPVSPEEEYEDKPAVPLGQADFDADAVEQTSQAPQAAGQMAPALPGGLPVRISKGGKQLYESTGPSGRWAPMVQGVFQAAAQHQDPEFAAAGKRAQEMATKLIGVDGIAPKDAIKFAASQLENEIQNITNFRRTELGTRPKWGGGGGSMGDYMAGAAGKAEAALNDDLDRVRRDFVNSEQYKDVVKKKVLVQGAQQQLNSPNGMSQQEAVSTLRRIQSGLTLNAFETTEFNNAAGALEGLYNRANKLFGGGQLSPEYKRQLVAVFANIQKTLDNHQRRLGQEAYDYWVGSRENQAKPELITRKGEVLRKSLQGSAGGSADEQADALLGD